MRIGVIIRNLFIALAVSIVLIAAAVFFYRYQILQYSADAIIRKSLPSYIQVDSITFQPDSKKIILRGFKILNPPEFSNKYLLEVQEVVCEYKMRGQNILEGIDVVEPLLDRPVLTVERQSSGTINLIRMPQYIQGLQKSKPDTVDKKSWLIDIKKVQKEAVKKLQETAGNKSFADMVKLPEVFLIKKGRMVFIDRMLSSKVYIISLDDIEAEMSLRLDKTYTKVLSAGSQGHGLLDDEKDQTVQWNSLYNPTTPRLTMGNRFVVSGLDLLTFKPYYDRFLPFDFKRGRFTGTLVFDFDNGNIGSTNEIHLSNLAFSIKRGFEDTVVWGTPVTDVAKYFTSPQGDIVFDFKLKGDMSNPKFDLGPISKRAITAMAVDKVSQVLENMANKAQEAAKTTNEGSGGKETDAQKAAKYIGIISEMMSTQKQK